MNARNSGLCVSYLHRCVLFWSSNWRVRFARVPTGFDDSYADHTMEPNDWQRPLVNVVIDGPTSDP